MVPTMKELFLMELDDEVPATRRHEDQFHNQSGLMTMKIKWRGVMPAMTTTFKPDLSVDHAAVAKQALPHFYEIKYWPLEDDGLAKANLDRVIATEKEVGGIKPGKEPVTYEKLVDRGVWKEAEALRK